MDRGPGFKPRFKPRFKLSVLGDVEKALNCQDVRDDLWGHAQCELRTKFSTNATRCWNARDPHSTTTLIHWIGSTATTGNAREGALDGWLEAHQSLNRLAMTRFERHFFYRNRYGCSSDQCGHVGLQKRGRRVHRTTVRRNLAHRADTSRASLDRPDRHPEPFDRVFRQARALEVANRSRDTLQGRSQDL